MATHLAWRDARCCASISLLSSGRAGTDFIDVFQQRDADHYDLIGHAPGSFRAKTAILVPEFNQYFVAAPRHLDKVAGVRVYEVKP